MTKRTTESDRGEPARRLPGELAPLPMRLGGAPLTDEEIVGVNRRIFAQQGTRARTFVANSPAQTELPAPDAARVAASYRLPPHLLWAARAKTEMEGITVTDLIIMALQGYAESPPGSTLTFVPPRLPNGKAPGAASE